MFKSSQSINTIQSLKNMGYGCLLICLKCFKKNCHSIMGDDILCEDVKCSQMKGEPPPSPKSHPQLFIPLALPYRSGLSRFGFVMGSKQALLLGLFLVLPSQRTSKCKSHHSPLSVTQFTLPLIVQQHLIQTPLPHPSLFTIALHP